MADEVRCHGCGELIAIHEDGRAVYEDPNADLAEYGHAGGVLCALCAVLPETTRGDVCLETTDATPSIDAAE